MKIYNNVTDIIGKTPLIKYSDNILLKLEYLNPSGSIKDRAAYYMLRDANLDKDTVVIEPTSGNTGIGLAMCCAVMNLKLIIVMPENMSEERKKLISAYGAELVLTPKNDGMQGTVKKAEEISKQYKKTFIPMQFSNLSNVNAHIETTSKEIYEDTDGKVDIVVAGIGTAGTIIGLSQGLKKLNKNIKAYGVEPAESPLITKEKSGLHKIQGIGANFIPDLYSKNELDGVFTVKGDDAINEARNLAKTHGILCGISSGANLYAAKILSQQNPDKIIVTTINDSGERYLSTELFE